MNYIRKGRLNPGFAYQTAWTISIVQIRENMGLILFYLRLEPTLGARAKNLDLKIK